jgi:hypothetical protein
MTLLLSFCFLAIILEIFVQRNLHLCAFLCPRPLEKSLLLSGERCSEMHTGAESSRNPKSLVVILFLLTLLTTHSFSLRFANRTIKRLVLGLLDKELLEIIRIIFIPRVRFLILCERKFKLECGLDNSKMKCTYEVWVNLIILKLNVNK